MSSTKVFRKFTDKDEILQYFPNYQTYREKAHKNPDYRKWGQLKLFLFMTQFLTRYLRDEDQKSYVVYAGAAPGTNILILASLFPQVEFHLYDREQKNPFNRYLRKYSQGEKIYLTNHLLSSQIKKQHLTFTDVSAKENSILLHGKNVFLYDQYMTDELAETWKSKTNETESVYFVSDIRKIEYATRNDAEDDAEVIASDLKDQLRWHNIMRPRYSSFKFRFPYYEDNHLFPYPNGLVYYQCWIGHTSTETRLVVEQEYEMKDWSTIEYQNRLFDHNQKRDQYVYTNPLTGESNPSFDLESQKTNLRNKFDDALSLHILQLFLKRYGGEKHYTHQQIINLWYYVYGLLSSASGTDLYRMEEKNRQTIERDQTTHEARSNIVSKNQAVSRVSKPKVVVADINSVRDRLRARASSKK